MSAGKHTYVRDEVIRKAQSSGTARLKQERNRAYLFIGVLALCVIVLSVAVVVLSQIHTVVPVVSVIDANGHVIRQQVVEPKTITGQESFVQSQVYNFVHYCNTFDPAWRQRYADLCRLHSSPEVAAQYDAETGADSPDNPYLKLGKGRRFPKITGITSLGLGAYQVAFQLVTEKPGAAPQVAYYTALVKYVFTHHPMALEDRWENALGFVVTAYRKDQELSHMATDWQDKEHG